MTDLKEWLLAPATPTVPYTSLADICAEAAARITQLEAEIAGLQQALADTHNERAALLEGLELAADELDDAADSFEAVNMTTCAACAAKAATEARAPPGPTQVTGVVELLALAERCEAAPANEQRQMLKDAYAAIFGGPDCTPINRWPGYLSPQWDRFYAMLDAEAYESAAMQLVPEGWERFDVDATAPELGIDWTLHGPERRKAKGTAATPALALTAACLKARAQKERSDG